MRALVTSSRNIFALDIIRKLGSLGHTVVASDTYHGATGSHSKFATAHVVTASPRFDTDQFMADIIAAVAKYDIDLIIPTFEEVFYLAARRHELPDGVELYSGSFADLARLHDKASFRRIIEASGVPIPETVIATTHDELVAATERFPRFFARAAFSRGGVGLLTNTGPLAGHLDVADVTPTPEQPWLVQPFVDGPMICTYSTIVNGRVTSQCTYSAPEQWAHSTGITFLAMDSTKTLAYTQKIVSQLSPGFTGQLSFDFVDHDGELYAIECNPRPTNGVILFSAEEFDSALTGAAAETIVATPGTERQISLAVLADAFMQPLSHLPTTLHDLVNVRDIGSGRRDPGAMLWSPATLVHGAQLSRGTHEELLKALGDDIVWNGEPINGMSAEDAATLAEVHAQQR